MLRPTIMWTALLAITLTLPIWAQAEGPQCLEILKPNEVVQCALARNTDVLRARQELEVIAGTRLSASIWLPSRPNLSVSGGHRRSQEPTQVPSTAIDWYVTLSQEIEIAGQRNARLDAVDATAAAQVRRVAALERETSATALKLYYRLLSAQTRLQLAERSADVADKLNTLAQAQAKEAMLSPLEADLAWAEAARLKSLHLTAKQEATSTEASLRQFLGVDTAQPMTVEGKLPENQATEESFILEKLLPRALAMRGEIAAAESEQQALSHRLNVLEREQAPNITVSVTAQNDGFNERFWGAGISIPIPLPSPVVPNRAGEITEMKARIVQAETDTTAVHRRVEMEVTTALANVRWHASVLALYPDELIQRSQRALNALAEAISGHRFSLREALFAQRSLIDLLQATENARVELAISQIELARAAALPFPGVEP